MKQALHGDALQLVLERLAPELGRTDRDRLLNLATLATSTGIRLSDCLPTTGTAQQKQADFRYFRKQINDAATRAGVDLELAVDSKKRDKPEDRRCTFLGADPSAALVENYNRAVTKDLDSATLIPAQGLITSSSALENQKTVVRFFVSYAHDDSELAEKLLTALRKQFGASKRYEAHLWYDGQIEIGVDWEARINKAMSDSAFGLFLVSPSFLTSKFITGKELPAFMAKEREGKIPLPVALVPVDLQRHDLKGLEARQIFYRKGRCFNQQTSTADKTGFSFELYQKIEDRLDSHFAGQQDKPDPSRHIHIPDEEAKHFIDTHGFRVTAADPDKLDASAINTEPRDVCAELESWAIDARPAAPRFFALLGEYGLGKTTTLKHFSRELAAKRQTDKKLPLPIYLDLRYYQGPKDCAPLIEALIQSVVDHSWRPTGKTPKPEDILRLVREEGAIILFDGLDEQLVHMTPSVGKAFVRTLWSAIGNSEKGKLLVSCRSHYYRDVSSQNSALSGDDREGLRKEEFPIICLLPFTEEQIRNYLEKVLGTSEEAAKAFELLEKVHNLRELAERPYLLSLITARLAELEALQIRGETVNAARLYDLMVTHWLNRDDGKHQINLAHKRLLMEELAAALWTSGKKRWHIDRVERWLDQFLFENPSLAAAYANKDRDVLKEDFRTATFVLRPDTERDNFGFAHTSLQEFFLAAYLVRAVEENKAARWSMPRVSWETFEFVGQLVQTGKLDASGLNGLLEGDQIVSATQAFGYWVTAVKRGYPQPEPSSVNLANADLEEWRIENMSLRGANLAGAQLNRARLQSVDLAGADLTGASACEAVFIDVTAEGALSDGGGLGYPEWRNSAEPSYSSACWQDTLVRQNLGLARVGGQWAKAPAPPRPGNRAFLSAGHSKGVRSCAWSPDGQHIVSGSADSTVKVWDRESGKCLQTFQGHSDCVRSCVWSPDGQHIVSGSDDSTIKVWDWVSGRCLQTFQGHSDSVKSCSWSPDGQHIVSGSDDSTIKVWDWASGKCLQTFQGHSYLVMSCAWSRDGQYIVSGSADHTVKVWDRRSGKCLQTFQGHSDWVMSCAWSPDGRHIVSGSSDSTVKVWGRASGKCLQTFEGHSDWVRSCAWSPDGRRIVSGSSDSKIKVWDRVSGKCLQAFQGHSALVNSCDWSPDGRHIVSGCSDCTVKVWSRASGKCLQIFQGLGNRVNSCAWSPDGQHIVSGSYDSTVKVWDRASGKCLQTFQGHTDGVNACAWSPDGQHIVSASADRTVKVWDRASGKCLQTFQGHADRVNACAWSPDGQHIVSGSDDSTVKVWDRASGKCLQTLRGHANGVTSCAWSPDGQHIVSGSGDSTVKVWDWASGKCLQTLRRHANGVDSCACSPDGLFIASGSADSTVNEWDRVSGKCLQTYQGHANGVMSCAWSPDGQHIVSGSHDSTVKVWDRASGKCLQSFQGHASGVTSCAWSPDGQHIVSGSNDCTAKVWDVHSGLCVETFCNLPENQTATIGNNQFLWASKEAWRWLGWQVTTENGPALLPCDTFGPIPGLEYDSQDSANTRSRSAKS